MSATVDVPETFGALLLGALFALTLSGVVAVQATLYFKLYPSDPTRMKLLVSTIWLLDICHSAFVCTTIWVYLISHYGESARINDIPWSTAMTILFTAILTFLVHCYFAHRIYRLSKGKWYITGPILFLALFRLASASVTTSEMLRLGTFSAFTQHFRWVFTLGLAISSIVDILIAGSLCYFLRVNRSGSTNLNHIMDLLVLYAVENGSITCASTIASMICWLTMPHNRIFLGLHFIICKLYANSLLATLNTRQQLRHGRSKSEDHALPVIFRDGFGGRSNSGRSYRNGQSRNNPPSEGHQISTNGMKVSPTPAQLQINVAKSVQIDRGCPSPESDGKSPSDSHGKTILE